ncbi:MAG: nucleotidyltransferase domain-containing protein [Candidatus Omnitrophica bacterium]|nr:nucleotidyltransferase domain-containing protein [Candidatus Omnitrophota bacterium]
MDITKIFKSKARQAIFRLYFTNPDKGFYLRELERELEIPVSMLRKELIALEKKGLFSSSKQGNLLYYNLNKEFPIYNELKIIVFKTIGIQAALSKILLPLKGIEAAFIYGSYAKNADNAKSDIDLFIIGNPDEDALVEKINNLEKNLKREINYSIYSRNDFEKKKNQKDSFIEDVLKNKKIFLAGGKNGL